MATITGTEIGEYLQGTSADDTIIALAGNDFLYGLGGDDVLMGGEGDDTYRFNVNDGNDVITDLLGANSLQFSSNALGSYSAISSADFSISGYDLVISLTIGEYSQQVTITDYYREQLDFSIFYNTAYGGAFSELSRDLLPILRMGGEADDTIVGGLSNDVLSGGAGSDTINGGEGNDYLDGGEGSDTLYGDEGNDILFGGEGADILFGGDGADILYGDGSEATPAQSAQNTVSAQNAVVTSTDNNDMLNGGSGDDSYIFQSDFGHDEIEDMDGDEKLLFRAARGLEDFSIARSGGAIVITTAEGSVDIVKGSYVDGRYSIHFGANDELLGKLYFEDLPINNARLSGGSTEDWLLGLAGNDNLNGGAGNDILDGGAGDDTYVFSSGDGDDIIYGDESGQEALYFKDASGREDFAFARQAGSGRSNDVLITIATNANSDSVTIRGASFQNGVYSVHYGASNQLLGKLYLGDVVGDTLTGGSDKDWLVGLAGEDRIIGNAGNDILYGGAGDDNLMGGVGDDKYRVDAADGTDVINDLEGENSIYFHSTAMASFAGITSSDFSVNGDDLVISLTAGGTSQQVTLTDYYLSPSSFTIFYNTAHGGSFTEVTPDAIPVQPMPVDPIPVEPTPFTLPVKVAIPFGPVDGEGELLLATAEPDSFLSSSPDWVSYEESPGWLAGRIMYGVNIDLRDVPARASGAWARDDYLVGIRNLIGSDYEDFLFGNVFDNNLRGRVGDDHIFGYEGADGLAGGAGNDDLYGGEGDDTLEGGSGNDFLGGGAGEDWLEGGTGNDELNGGAGADWLDGGSGVDTYLFSSKGYGADLIQERAGSILNLHFTSNFAYVPYTDADFIEAADNFNRVGNNLEITIDKRPDDGITDKITILNAYDSNPNTGIGNAAFTINIEYSYHTFTDVTDAFWHFL